MGTGSTLRNPDPVLVSFGTLYCLVQKDLLSLEIAQLWCGHLGSLKCVVFEQPFFDTTIRKLHASHTVLNAFGPLSLVARAILPVHLSVAGALVTLVAPLVVVSAFPREHADSIFLVIFIEALIHVTILIIESLLPFSFAMFKAIFELSHVNASIFPFILA